MEIWSACVVDSVQNMDDDTSATMDWYGPIPWDIGDPPYDDTLTIGFHICGQALDALERARSG